MTITYSALVQFVGHLHPMFVHLPIGFLLLLGALEICALFRPLKHLGGSSRAILIFTVPACAASIFCGWVLAAHEDYDPQILFYHRWLGTGIGVTAVILLLLHWRGWLGAYRCALAVTLVLVALGGHFGASLTHGSNYLSLTPSRGDAKQTDPADAQSFYALGVQPILKQYCVACHGPEKSKGKLKLDTLENILKGGDTGAAIVPGAAAQSLLIKRLRLAPDEDEHMPPHAKPQPSAAQIALLEWWVNSGASGDKTVPQLNPPAEVLGAIPPRATLP